MIWEFLCSLFRKPKDDREVVTYYYVQSAHGRCWTAKPNVEDTILRVDIDSGRIPSIDEADKLRNYV